MHEKKSFPQKRKPTGSAKSRQDPPDSGGIHNNPSKSVKVSIPQPEGSFDPSPPPADFADICRRHPKFRGHPQAAPRSRQNVHKQKPHKGIWRSARLGSVPGIWGRVSGTSGTSRPVAGETGCFHGMVIIQMRRCPIKFLSVCWFFYLKIQKRSPPWHIPIPWPMCWGPHPPPPGITLPLYPWGRLDYICNSKTNKSVTVSVIFWKLI